MGFYCNILAWLSFRKIYVASWWVSVKPCHNCKLLSRHKFPSNYKLARWTLSHIFRSQYKPSGFWNENFLPYISPSKNEPLKRAFEKYKLRGLFSEFYGTPLHWLPLHLEGDVCVLVSILINRLLLTCTAYGIHLMYPSSFELKHIDHVSFFYMLFSR